MLVKGSDLLALAEDAVERGADVIGMAGGDGSQALVASVASRHGIPMVVIPAGTRNHFALDLGIDREDVVGALEAYDEGIERRIDLAEVNGRVFVNNASMGLYAKIVQSQDYRDAKVRTAAETLPDLIGPNAVPLDLRFTLPSGEQITSANLVLVSNNPYQLSHLRGASTRPRLDTGRLGVVSVLVRGAGTPRSWPRSRPPGRFAVRRVERVGGDRVRGDLGGAGRGRRRRRGPDDGSPLRFVIRPGALTVRLPRAVLSRRTPARPCTWFGLDLGAHRSQPVRRRAAPSGRPGDAGTRADAGVEPVEERLARRLERGPAGTRRRPTSGAAPARALDRAVYVRRGPAVDAGARRAAEPAVALRQPLQAVVPRGRALAAFGGPTGRRAAADRGRRHRCGVARREPADEARRQPGPTRPDGHEVPEARWVPMPTSTSFPSGHSASALAFAVAVGDVVPALRWPLRAAGGTVAFSRVYTGVHYPGDVLVGAPPAPCSAGWSAGWSRRAGATAADLRCGHDGSHDGTDAGGRRG